MNNYPYFQQPYGQFVESDDNIPRGQPMDNQIQMTSFINPQQQSQYIQQQPFQMHSQQYQQNPQYFGANNYLQLPPQNQMQASHLYSSNIHQQNNIGFSHQNQSQQNRLSQVRSTHQQLNNGMLPVARFPTSRQPQQLYCDNCKQNNQTKVGFKNGSGSYVAGGIIAACGFWLGCCLIPCMIEDCQDAEHSCTRCGYKIGSKRFLFD